MFADNRKISLRQLQALLLLDFFGTTLLFLPGELALSTKNGCWSAAAILGGLFTAISLLLTTLGKTMPDGTVVQWCRSLLGGIVGNLVLLGLAAKLWLDGAVELRLFTEVVSRTMLPSTPMWILSLVILIVSGALAAQGMECRGRAAEVLFFFVAVPLVVILIAVAISSEYRRVMPLALPQLKGMAQSLPEMSVVFQGLVFLYFVFPGLKKPHNGSMPVAVVCLLFTLVLTAIVFLCLAVYGADTLPAKLLPTLQMMERVSFTGVFLTRLDVILLWFWMAAVTVFLSGTLFFGSLLAVQLCHQSEGKRKYWLFAVVILLFIGGTLPPDFSGAYGLRLNMAPWFNGFYLLGLPLLLLFLSRVRKGGGANG